MYAAERLRRAVTVVVALIAAAASVTAQAQVRPDTTQRPPGPPPSGPPGAPAPGDSAEMKARLARFKADSAHRDSIDKVIKGDTVKTPLAHFERPDDFEITDRLRFTREQILSTGAENITDILDRVPGITTYRSGWMAGLHVASYLGDGSRLRLFLDGIELDPIGAREHGVYDLTDVSLWTLDELIVERAAGEVRVWLRTWTVTKTIPFTRVDIFTGDLNTNAFRGQFARRWRNGMLLQLGGQQIATQTGRVSAFSTTGLSTGRSDGTVQGFLARVGWSRGTFSIDAFANGVSRDRDKHIPRTSFIDTLPSYKGYQRDGYVRVGYGDTTRGFWSQVLVQARLDKLDNKDSTVISGTDTTKLHTDTLTSRTQQVLAVGYRTTWWHASLTDRMRLDAGTRRHAPAVRAGAQFGMVDVGVWAEQHGRDSTNRVDLFARATPLPWLRITGAVSSRTPDDSTERLKGTTMRVEGAVRFRNIWFGGGLLRDDASSYDNIRLIGTPAATLPAEAAQGLLASVQGPLYRAIRFDFHAIRWNTAQYNRPQTQIHGEVSLVTEWRKRFPKGEFGINARFMYDSRDGVPFYYGTDDIRITEAYQTITGLLEIRIQQATLFYQYRNLTGGAYEQIRGITMPPAVQMYGMRWNFFN